MGVMSIPVRLSLTESCAAALYLAADGLEAAKSTESFLAAIDHNHCLWLSIAGIVDRHQWSVPDSRLLRFVLSTNCQNGHSLDDGHVESLIHINRTVAHALVHDQNVQRVMDRVHAAWIDTGRRLTQPIHRWLVGEIDRKAMLHS